MSLSKLTFVSAMMLATAGYSLQATAAGAAPAPMAAIAATMPHAGKVTAVQFRRGWWGGWGGYRGYGWRGYGWRGYGYGGPAILGGVLVGSVVVAAAVAQHRAQESALRHCAADFRSFDWRSGTYVDYNGSVRVCPYLY